MQSLYLNDVKNAKVRGVTSVNSMGFHMHVTNSANIRINGVHIIAPADSPNTDGMHISRSYAVRVAKAVIRTGDDCISLGQGATNINISRVTCGPGHGIRYPLLSPSRTLLYNYHDYSLMVLFVLTVWEAWGSYQMNKT